MPDQQHHSMAGVDMHTPYRGVFADEAARLAHTTVANDVGCVFKQTDNNGLYELTSQSPDTWVHLNPTQSGGGGSSAAIDLSTAHFVGKNTNITFPGDNQAFRVGHLGVDVTGCILFSSWENSGSSAFYINACPIETPTIGLQANVPTSEAAQATISREGHAILVDPSLNFVITNESDGGTWKIGKYDTTRATFPTLSAVTYSNFDLTTTGISVNQVKAAAFSPDGTRFVMYQRGSNSGKLHQFTCSTPFDITTLSAVTTRDTVSDVGLGTDYEALSGHGLQFNEDGTKLFLWTSGITHRYVLVIITLLTAYDITTQTAVETRPLNQDIEFMNAAFETNVANTICSCLNFTANQLLSYNASTGLLYGATFVASDTLIPVLGSGGGGGP